MRASRLSFYAVAVLGLVDDKGMIDIDAVAEAAKENARKRGKLELDLPIFGKFKFNEEDFDKLRECIVGSEA